MRTSRLPPVPALFLFCLLVVFHLLGMPATISFLVPDLVHADEGDTGISGRAVSGRVLSATDAKPLAGVVLTLAGQISTTDATGRFTFKQPSSGYQLIKIQHASLNAYRKPLKNGTPGGLMHADPVLVNVSPDKAIELPDPIWVVQTHAVAYPMTPGQKIDDVYVERAESAHRDQWAEPLRQLCYDGLGRRSSKTINSTTTGFWYDGDDVLAELSSSTPTATYIRSLSIDEPFIRKQSGGDEFYQGDALGSALVLTDGTGTAQTTYTVEPFGKTTKTGTSTNAFQYTGREDDGTGVMYYRARYYHPLLQRFLRQDPLSFAAGMNVYAYAGNNPLGFADPMGLDIIVRYYPLGAYGLGHVGIAVNTDGDDTVDTVAFGYEPSYANDLAVARGKSVPGAVISDMGRIRGDTIRIRTTPAQDKAVTAYIANRTVDPGKYNLSGRNCALFVQGAMKAAGIPLPEDPYIYVPDIILTISSSTMITIADGDSNECHRQVIRIGRGHYSFSYHDNCVHRSVSRSQQNSAYYYLWFLFVAITCSAYGARGKFSARFTDSSHCFHSSEHSALHYSRMDCQYRLETTVRHGALA